MATKRSFGSWVKQRRKALGLTQRALAQQVGCALSTIQKIEIDDRQPSQQIAELLAEHLEVAPAERDAFLHLARHQPTDQQPMLTIVSPLRRPINNLPSPLTSLVGREWEVTTLCAWLQQAEVRLLTITGPPGIGKTRLCLQTATQAYEHFSDGVCFVPLAAINEARFVTAAIARALEVKDTGGQPLLERLKGYLRERQLLLVLDNFEHLLPTAPLVAELLEVASALKVLTTSRALLQVYGEHEFVTPPLALPNLKQLPTHYELAGYASVELFVQRARAARLDFVLSAENAPAVAELCVRMDGLPLAIELAAARTKRFSPQTLLAHLQEALTPRLTLLTGAHHLPDRHRTLRDAIGWSYKLLTPTEQRIFRCLGVFAGGCTLEALAATVDKQVVASGLPLPRITDHWLLQTVEALVNQSLVTQAAEPGKEPRFSLLEMIREYALEQLEQHGETEMARRAHATYFLQVAQKAECITLWRQLQNWLELGMALQFQALIFFYQGDCLAACSSVEESVAILRAIDESWQLAIALKNLGRIQLVQGDAIAARAFIEESIDIMQRRTNIWGVSNGLLALSELAFAQDDCCSAFTYLEEALHYYQTTNETWFLAQARLAMGKVFWRQGNKSQATTLWNESIMFAREAGAKQFLSGALFMAGLSARENGDLQGARILFKESLALFQAMGNPVGVAYTLSGLASISGQAEQAVKVLGAASTVLDTARLPLDQIERAHYEQIVASVRARLDEATFAAAWVAGRAMTLEQAATALSS